MNSRFFHFRLKNIFGQPAIVAMSSSNKRRPGLKMDFTDEQLSEAREAFDLFDTDGSGEISAVNASLAPF